MNAKQNAALEVCYSNSCASKRLGLPKQAVEDLKRRNRREPQSGDGVNDTDFSVGIGGFEIGGSLDGDISLSIPGVSISIEDNGEGSIEFPGNMRMDVVKDGCYFVKNFYVFDQLAYQDVELDPDCDDKEVDEEDRDLEPESDEWDEEGLPEDENDPEWDKDPEEDFDEGDKEIHDNDYVVVIYGFKHKEQYTHEYYISQKQHKTFKRINERTSYKVLEQGNYKGVRYPTKIELRGKASSATIVYRKDGGVENVITNYEQDDNYYINRNNSEPFCGNTVSYFERNWGRTLKDGAKQRRYSHKRYNQGFNGAYRYSTYHGHERANIDGEFQDVCPLISSDGDSSGGAAYAPHYQGDTNTQFKLLYRKVLRGREEKGKPPGNIGKKSPKTMDKKCCKMIKEIHEALAVRELNQEGFQIPGRLIAPNASQSVKADNYLKILALQCQIQDHLGVHPFKASLSDANAAKTGKQKVEAQLVSGTAAMQKIVELLLENKGDAAARLNLQVRSAIIQAQILNAVTIAAQSIKSLVSFVGMPIKEKLSYIAMPFDPSLGARQPKGFDPKKASQKIKVNTEAATEEILPKFLKSAEQPYVYEGYDGKQPSLIENIKGIGRQPK